MMSPLVFFFFLIQLANQTRVSSVSWGHGRIDLFVKGTNSDVWHTYYDNSHWYPWENLNAIGSDPAACSWGQGRIDVFMYGYSTTSTDLYHNYYDYSSQGPKWGFNASSWEPGLDTNVAEVSCFANGYGHIQIATIHTDHNLYTRSWPDSTWYNLSDNNVGAAIPGIMIIYPYIFFFAKDMSSNVIYKIVNNINGSYTTVTNWTRTGDSTLKGVAVAAWDNTRIDIFFLGSDSTMYQKTIVKFANNSSWNFTAPNTSMGNMTFGGTPSVTSWGYGRFDVFGISGSQGFIWTKTYDLCNGWSEWTQLGNFVAG